MEAVFATLTDNQRVETLNNLYKKSISTPKGNLAFSADKLVYLKPFISRLQNTDGVDQDLNSRIMVRSVVDELLKDILAEIEVASGNGKNADKIALEYGLGQLVQSVEENFYYTSKVA
ncbi:MAG: hypothetical protein GC178_07745 [Flavobacteriales bacterium]|nr:hypothetical protein [Flavobacteriales bacterium]